MSFVAVAIGATAVSAYSTIKAGKAQRRASKTQRQADRLQSFQNQMQQLRDYQVAVAQAGTAWQGSGASLESSGARGARSATGSQLAQNIDMIGRGAQISNQYSSAMNKANRWQGIGQIASTVGSTALTLGSVTPQTTDEFINLPDQGTVPQGGVRLNRPPPPPGSRGI